MVTWLEAALSVVVLYASCPWGLADSCSGPLVEAGPTGVTSGATPLVTALVS
jgi:hypothetical protein